MIIMMASNVHSKKQINIVRVLHFASWDNTLERHKTRVRKVFQVMSQETIFTFIPIPIPVYTQHGEIPNSFWVSGGLKIIGYNTAIERRRSFL